jgi:uncharacterized membrane protein
MQSRTQRLVASYLLAAFLCFLVTLLSVLQLADHYGFRTQLHDLGIMEQAIWQITQGELDMPTSYPSVGLSRLARHRNLIFYAVAPFYAILPHSETLLLLTPLSLAAACLILFRFSNILLLGPFVALGFAIALGMNSFLQNLMLYDFRADTLAVPLIVGLVYLVHLRRARSATLVLLALLMVKEDMVFTVIALAPWIAHRWSKRIGFSVLLLSLSYWLLVWKALPLWMGFSTTSPFWGRFAYLGASPEEAILTLLTNPGIAWPQLTACRPLTYLATMALQTGGLALCSPLLLLGAAPSVIFNALDEGKWQSHIVFVYYSGIPVTIIYLAALHGYVVLRKYHKISANILLSVFLFQATALSSTLGPTPLGSNVAWLDYKIDENLRRDFAAISQAIPPDARLATQNNLAPHFTKRPIVIETEFWQSNIPADYILLGLFPPVTRQNPYLDHDAITLLGTTSEIFLDGLRILLTSQDFGLTKREGPFLLFRRGEGTKNNHLAHSLLAPYQDPFAIPNPPVATPNDCF